MANSMLRKGVASYGARAQIDDVHLAIEVDTPLAAPPVEALR
ncbi:hypothetical protein CpipJ_CPIJ002144 [Culex quinquefasciatus]|uniref:Uncharacterized protein n=1 Tax=Culex quinquefasciatus TaxID=7176 RepID=B0W3X8_CULQU|nr:hypothetical protein CpipJ_CPIJ002144 [Culex quinquefasciatus]|eukprot:XP_001843412.1 hypothetical protein CpipJ_CPIJ002144 [Culex quinquefasciatus]